MTINSPDENLQSFESLLATYDKKIVNNGFIALAHSEVIQIIKRRILAADKINQLVIVPSNNEKEGKFDGRVHLLQRETPENFGKPNTTIGFESLRDVIQTMESVGYTIVAVPTKTDGYDMTNITSEKGIRYNIYASPKIENNTITMPKHSSKGTKDNLVDALVGPSDKGKRISKKLEDERLSSTEQEKIAKKLMAEIKQYIQSVEPIRVTAEDIKALRYNEWAPKNIPITIRKCGNEAEEYEDYYYNCSAVPEKKIIPEPDDIYHTLKINVLPQFYMSIYEWRDNDQFTWPHFSFATKKEILKKKKEEKEYLTRADLTIYHTIVANGKVYKIT